MSISIKHFGITLTNHSTLELDDLWYGGPNVSPFVRAYPPELVHHGIAEQDFMDFMDGFNESWLINPAMNYFGIATGVAGVFSGPARFHSIGPISWAAAASSIPVSIARTKTYLKTWNKKLFNPVGLQVKVLKTDALMSALGHSGENVWEEYARHATKYEHVERELCNRATEGKNSPEQIKADAIKLIQKRMEPLAPYVSPLSFDVPPPKELEGGWMKKWEGKEAQRMEYSQMKRLQHTKEKQLKKSMDKEHKDRERVANLYSEIQATQDALDSPTETHHEVKIKHLADLEQKLRKLYVEIDEDTEVRFEERVKKSGKETKSLRWVVITGLGGGILSSVDSIES